MKRNLRLTSVGPRRAAQVFVSLILAVASQLVAAQTLQYSEVAGTLPDLTPYRMRLPANWNGTLINDLDYASGANSASKLSCCRAVTRYPAPGGRPGARPITIRPGKLKT
jgi:hypothetical protein